MKRTPKRSILLDRLHKGFVLTCVCVTLGGTGYLALGWYKYFTEVKPALKQKQLLDKQSLLAEGSSDNLQDLAPTLKM